jgi:hypothetical protein
MLAPGKAIVVFSGASAIPAGSTNAVAASSGGLFFNKGSSGGDTAYLQDSTGKVVDSFTYMGTTEAVSYNRSPDASASGSFVLHTTLPSGLNSSPGERADGTAF